MWTLPLLSTLLGLLPLGGAGTAHAARAPVPFEGDFTVPVEQKDLDKFCKRHNGVTGDLIVGPDYVQRDLSALSCIHRVGGRLVIKKTPALERLDGLVLDQMGGVPLKALRIVDNQALVDVSGLSGAPQLRVARLVVQGNGRLQEVRGLPDVVSSSGIIIADNVDLVELEGPNGARRSTRLGEVYIGNNPRLLRVAGFDWVVGADAVSVKANVRLRELHGFARLTDVGTFEVVGLPLLVDWRAAPLLTHMERFEVRDCDGLEGLPGLPDLNRVRSISLVDNIMLQSVAGLTVSRTSHPTVDELVVTGNANLSTRATDQLVDRLHLPSDSNAVRVEGNGSALGGTSEEPWDAQRARELQAPAGQGAGK